MPGAGGVWLTESEAEGDALSRWQSFPAIFPDTQTFRPTGRGTSRTQQASRRERRRNPLLGQSFPTHKHFVLHTVGNLPHNLSRHTNGHGLSRPPRTHEMPGAGGVWLTESEAEGDALSRWQSFPTHKHFVLQAVGHLARSRRRGGRGEGTHFWMVQAHARRVPAVWESECRACQRRLAFRRHPRDSAAAARRGGAVVRGVRPAAHWRRSCSRR